MPTMADPYWMLQDDTGSDRDSIELDDGGLNHRPMRRLTETEWIEAHFEEISSVHTALMRYLQTYANVGILNAITFDAFCRFCYQQSDQYA